MAERKVSVWMVRPPEQRFEYEAICQVVDAVEALAQRMTAEPSWHLLCNVMMSCREMDLLLATSKTFITIELKQVPQKATVKATPNQWLKLLPNCTSEPFRNLPIEQAQKQGSFCRRWAFDAFGLDKEAKLKVRSIIAIAPARPPEGQQDDFQYVQENYKVGVCRVADIATVIERFLQYETTFALEERALEEVFRHKLGMEKALWLDGKPHAKQALDFPSFDAVEDSDQYHEQLMAHNARLKEINAQLEAQEQQSASQLLTLRQEKAACLQEIEFLRIKVCQLQERNSLEVKHLEEALAEARQQLAEQEALLEETKQKLTLQSTSLKLLETDYALEAPELATLKEMVAQLQAQYATLLLEKEKTEQDALRAKARYEAFIEAQKEKEAAQQRKLQAVVIPSPSRYGRALAARVRPSQSFVAGAMTSAVRAMLHPESILWDWAEALASFKVEGFAPSFLSVTGQAPSQQACSVLCNLLSRGRPSVTSPALETWLATTTGMLQPVADEAEVRFELTSPDILYRIKAAIEAMQGAGFVPTQCSAWQDNRDLYQLFYQPFLAARVQKTLLEAFLVEALPLKSHLRILAVEHDITGVAHALAELETMWRHLFALMGCEASEVPHFEVETVALQPAPATFYDGVTVRPLASIGVNTSYDLILETAFFEKEGSVVSTLERLLAPLKLSIGSTSESVAPRLYTGENITYTAIGDFTNEALFQPDPAKLSHLTYFLQLLFRKRQFLPGQLPILQRALQSLPVIGLLPTGGGKSLTYQFAALLQPGVSLVVAPLKSLMYDQVAGLRKEGIDLCETLNSDLSQAASEALLERVGCAQVKFLFVSPERLQIPTFRSLLQAMSTIGLWFSYGVIDEVHCLSEWGHDFRTSYLHLGRNLHQRVKTASGAPLPLIGLTATASFDVLADIERILSGEGNYRLGPEVFVRYEHTNRLELQYLIQPISTATTPAANRTLHWRLKRQRVVSGEVLETARRCLFECQQPEALKQIYQAFCERENLSEGSERYAAIYRQDICLPSRRLFDETLDGDAYGFASSALFFCPTAGGEGGVYWLYNALSEVEDEAKLGVFASTKPKDDPIDDAAFYAKNRATQAAFKNNQIQLMLATKAFGMGLDKPNIRLVVEMCHPGSLEALMQETGRAGRDHKLALCLIYYAADDKYTSLYFHQQNFVGLVRETIAMGYLWHAEIFQLPESTTRVSLEQSLEAAPTSRLILSLDMAPFAERKFTTWEREDLTLRQLWEAYERKHPEVKPDPNHILITSNLIKKVIYRLSLLGLVDDLLEDYEKNRLILYLNVKGKGEIYRALQAYLERYYMPKEAEAMVRTWRDAPQASVELLDAMARLTHFIYEKIEYKRRRAIEDVQAFCQCGCDPRYGKTWLERNEALKDYLYYTFNSKYARRGYKNSAGLPYSLYDDTEGGKQCLIEILWKYMSVTKAQNLAPDESPKDNIKHLHGAVRLLRRALIDENPILSLLEAYCTLMIAPPQTREQEVSLFNTLVLQGFRPLFQTYSLTESIHFIHTYIDTLVQTHAPLSSHRLSLLRHLLLADLMAITSNALPSLTHL